MKLTPLPLVVCMTSTDGRPGDHGASKQRGLEPRVVVAVDLPHRPTEGSQLVGQRLEGQRPGDRGQTLQLVVVNEGDEVVQSVMGGEHHRLPVGAFVHLAIAEHHEDAPGPALAARRERLAGAERQAVAERTRGELDAADFVADMGHEKRAVGAVSLQVVARQHADARQRRIDRRSGVPLAEDEAVAALPARVLRPQIHHAAVQHGQGVDDGEAAADV